MHYSKMEEYRMQVAEGQRRHREEADNIRRMPQRRCTFVEDGVRLSGTAVGAYKNNLDGYSAYHIEADDGRKRTVKADRVTFDLLTTNE